MSDEGTVQPTEAPEGSEQSNPFGDLSRGQAEVQAGSEEAQGQENEQAATTQDDFEGKSAEEIAAQFKEYQRGLTPRLQKLSAVEKRNAELEGQLKTMKQEQDYAYQRPEVDAQTPTNEPGYEPDQGQALTPELQAIRQEMAQMKAMQNQARWDRDFADMVKTYPELAGFKDAAQSRRDKIYNDRAVMPHDTAWADAGPTLYAELQAAKAEIVRIKGGGATAAGGQSGNSRPVGDRGDNESDTIRAARETLQSKDATKQEVRQAQRHIFGL